MLELGNKTHKRSNVYKLGFYWPVYIGGRYMASSRDKALVEAMQEFGPPCRDWLFYKSIYLPYMLPDDCNTRASDARWFLGSTKWGDTYPSKHSNHAVFRTKADRAWFMVVAPSVTEAAREKVYEL